MKNIGKIAATKGLDGELKVKIFHDLKIEELDSLFIETKRDLKLPFSVDEWIFNTHSKMTIILKLEDVTNKESADKLVGKSIWIESDQYQSILPEESIFRFIGFMLEANENKIGLIDEIVELAQPIFILKKEKEDIMIPFVKDWVIEINTQSNIIKMNIPDGLLEINATESNPEKDD